MLLFDYNKFWNDGAGKTIIKADTIPEAGQNTLGEIYIYSGTTNEAYTHGYIYECVEEGSSYVWKRLDVQPSVYNEGGVAEVTTPDGSDKNAIVNVNYVDTVVGNIENVLETI